MARKDMEAGAEELGKPEAFAIPTTGDTPKRPDAILDTVQGPLNMDKAAAEAFAAEEVLIEIAQSDNPNDENPVQLTVNSRNQFVFRGLPQLVKRKYIEVLARAKRTAYTQDTYTDPATGDVKQRMVPHVGLRYPFTVVEDRNPRGRDWLKAILAQRV